MRSDCYLEGRSRALNDYSEVVHSVRLLSTLFNPFIEKEWLYVDAARSVPSGTAFPVDTAETTQTGIIGLFASSDGSFLGFYQMPGSPLASTLAATKRSTYAGAYTFNTPAEAGDVFEIYLAESTAYTLAGIGWSSALTLGPGQGAYVELTISGVSTAAGATPYDNLYETTIYTIDDATGEVTANWVNPSGTTIQTFFMWSPARTALVFTGDTTAAKSDFVTDAGTVSSGTGLGSDAVEVALYFGDLTDWSGYY
ncbi:hypothetical protein DFH07DRAFT_966993 [Mycena maculata]|uniref:Uncharacterized protein n=1 Tax=Mycena maculata TaxID=230809 RepID=A0AAD7I6R8_9AGAR|nr:hypothetical protein DFH07DRAFT_966993 [Mycena maculata]